MQKKHFICVTGNIGSGKTTVSNIIESVFGFKKPEEVVENNPYLPLFYKDMRAWSYKIQRYFLMTRFVAHENIAMSNESCVQDRSIYEDMEIFAPLQLRLGNFTPEQWKRYRMFCKLVYDEIKPPDLVIYLHASIPVLRQRIASRGRDYEKNLTDPNNTYIVELQKLYDKWIKSYNLGPKLIIDTDNMNFVENPEHIKMLISKIRSNIGRKEAKLSKFAK